MNYSEKQTQFPKPPCSPVSDHIWHRMAWNKTREKKGGGNRARNPYAVPEVEQLYGQHTVLEALRNELEEADARLYNTIYPALCK